MEDVAEEPTTTCQMNFARFERRLDVQMRVLSKNLLDDIAFQSDVVISHVTGGVDPQAVSVSIAGFYANTVAD